MFLFLFKRHLMVPQCSGRVPIPCQYRKFSEKVTPEGFLKTQSAQTWQKEGLCTKKKQLSHHIAGEMAFPNLEIFKASLETKVFVIECRIYCQHGKPCGKLITEGYILRSICLCSLQFAMYWISCTFDFVMPECHRTIKPRQ